MRQKALAIVLSVLCLPGPVFAAQDVLLESALGAELTRALTGLKEPGYPPPYYVALTAIDVDAAEGRCLMGARAFSARYEQRLITPDLRVGDYTLDNHPITMPNTFVAHTVSRDDDEFALRHELWRMLDDSYKEASADFLRKEALRVQRGKTEYDFDDMTREQPRVAEDIRIEAPWDYAALDARCAQASAVFRSAPGLLHAEASYRARREWSRFRDSERSRVDFGRDYVEFELEAVDISTDGMRQDVTRRFAAPSPKDLPTARELEQAAREMSADLAALKLAKSTSPFSAPALIDPSVASAVVLAIGLRLSGEEQRNPAGAQTFRGRLGKTVLPSEFSLVDDPTQKDFAGKPLLGAYAFDDQGIAPRRVPLIERGVLKNLLLSRYPVIGFSQSNGHGRAFPGYAPEGAPGSLFLSSSKALPQAKLLERLRAECRRRGKPYGLWVRRLRNFAQQQGTSGHGSIRLMPTLVYLVDARTGEMILVRDLDMVGTPLAMLGNIIAAGDDVEARSLVYGVPMSVVVPSLLLTEAELQRSETKPEKLPIVPPPRGAAAQPERRSPPFVPNVPYVQVVLYRLHGAGPTVPSFRMDGLAALRQHGEGEDVLLEAKAVGSSLQDLGATLRRLDASMARLAGARQWERSSVTGSMTQSAYRSRYGDGWPD
jgi:TldD protein